jgi:hypothetical protein
MPGKPTGRLADQKSEYDYPQSLIPLRLEA